MSLTTAGVLPTGALKGQGAHPERLKTAEQWIEAAESGRVGYSTVMANEKSLTRRFGEDHFDLILVACKDLPGF